MAGGALMFGDKNNPCDVADNISNLLETACGEIGWQLARDTQHMSFDEFCKELKFCGFVDIASDKGRMRDIFRSNYLGDILAEDVFNNASYMQDMAGDWIYNASTGQEDPVAFRNAVIDILAKRMNHIPSVWENLRE